MTTPYPSGAHVSYLNIAELAASPAFRDRVQAAIATKATSVLGEDQSAMTGDRATKRLLLADQALLDPAQKVNAFVWSLVTNGTIAAKGMDASDGDLEYVVGWAWDRVAGVAAADMGA